MLQTSEKFHFVVINKIFNKREFGKTISYLLHFTQGRDNHHSVSLSHFIHQWLAITTIAESLCLLGVEAPSL